LPTALTAAMAVRDLARLCRNYPNALPNDEARQLHEQLLGWFELNYDFAGLLNLSEAYTRPPFGDAQTEEMMTGVVAALMLQHPDNQGSGDHSAAGVQARCKEIMHACQKACDPQVQAIVDRIMEVMMIDCRILEPSDDPTFRDPRRFLQMLRKYWELCKSIILFEMNAEMGFRPHPLLPLIVNLRERIGACCAALESEQQIPSVVENINTLLDTLLKGDVDDLGIAEEWATGQLQSVDTSLATLRLRLGSGAFPLTREEQLCLEHAEAAVSEHASRVRKHWTAVEHSVRKRAAEVVTQRPDTGARPDVQADVASSDSKSRTPKRSTSQFEARDKLIAELTRHHGYADGGCLNQDPIGNNKLAKAVGVSPSTASEFFRNKFEGHDKYRALCRDRRGLVAALRLLNDEFAPYHLLGDRTAAVAADQADVVDDA
jgi:AcrR family transcriptional regulator